MADTADQEVIRIVAQDQTGPGVQSAEARLKAGASRMASAGKIPISIMDKATSPLKAIGQQFQDIARIAERAAIGTLASMATLNFAHTVEEGVGRVQDFGAATIKMARETGQSAETASTLLAVLGELGVDSDAASRSLGIFSKGIHGIEDATEKALNGGKGVADAMHDLGVNFVDAQKNARPMNDVLLDVADRFHAMPDGVDKTAIAMQLFGRSGKDMIRFLDLGSQGIKDATDAATKFGMVLTNENVATLKEFGLAQRESTMAMHGFELQVGLLMLPLMTKLAEAGTTIASGLNATVVPAIGRLGSMIAGLPLQSMLNTLLSLGGRFATWLRGVLVIGLTDLWELLSPTRTFLGYALRWLIETAWPAFLGVMDRVAGFINDTMLPRLHELSDWLGQHLGNGLSWLADTAWPAMQGAAGAAATWITANVVPALQRLAAWVGTAFNDPVGTFTRLWKQVQDAMEPFSPTADRIGGALGALGSALAPVVTHIRDMATDLTTVTISTAGLENPVQRVADVVNGFSGALESAWHWLEQHKEIQAGMVGILAGTATAFTLQAVAAGADAIATGLASAAIWAMVAAETALDIALTANPIGIVVVALAALVAALVFAYNTNDEFRARVDAAFKVIGQAADILGAAFQAFGTTVREVFDQLTPAVGAAFDAIGTQVRSFFDGLGAFIRGALAGLLPIDVGPFHLSLEGGFRVDMPDLAGALLGAPAAAAPARAPTAPGSNMTTGGAYQSGGWLTEPIVGMGLQSGQRYSFVENGKPEYVVPAGGATGGSAGSGHTFTFGDISVTVTGADGPAAAWADGAEQLFNEFVRRVDMSMANRPQGAGRGAW